MPAGIKSTGDGQMREIRYRKRRSVKKIVIGGIIGTLLLAALIVFGLFRVQEVVITGNSIYTAKEIQEKIMQNGLCKNSLYLLWRYKDNEHVEEDLPFLRGIEVELLAPYRVQLDVYEKVEVGYVQYGGNNVYFDSDGVVLESRKQVRENVPLVAGLTTDKTELYEMLKVEDESEFRQILKLANMLSRNEIVPREIQIDGNGYVRLKFAKNDVLLGEPKDLEEKISALQAIFGKVSDMEGVLHMENFTADSQTVTFKQGTEESEISLDDGEGDSGESAEDTSQENTTGGRTYKESDGTFSTDADGNRIYTDAAGNVTPNVDQYNYTDENGNIITDGYGYIDPYTGAYIN